VKKSLIAVFGVALMSASLAEAQATRTWVSGVGDDVNPCSRTAPCKTWAGAISKTAAGGYMEALDPGAFGAVTITKSITIDGGGGGFAGILATFGSTGIIVNSPSAVVILRNLSIEGAGSTANPGLNGIRVIAAAQVHVEHCTIKNFSDNGILFVAAGDLFVSDTSIKEIINQGIYVQSGRTTLDRVVLNGNGFGLLVGSSAAATAKHTTASGNDTGFGTAYSAAAQLNLEDSVTTNNRYGVMALHGSSVRMSAVHVGNNSVSGLYNDGSGILASLGNNRFAGNAADGVFTHQIAMK
jgi:hypothetical protein